jgi:hypothetical protein
MKDRIKEYALEKYPGLFKGKDLIVVEKEHVWQISYKDGSPLFLSKNVLNNVE